MTRDNDIDVLVVEPAPINTRVVAIATERFEETKGIIGGIAYPAHKYGRVLYEAA